MITTNKILAIALITALVGASLGAAVMHSSNSGAATTRLTPATTTASNLNTDARYTEVSAPIEFSTTEQQTAYKVGFADGFQAGAESNRTRLAGTSLSNSFAPTNVSRRSQGTYYSHASAKAPGRTFWSKHRDKLTMAMGTGGGALIGSLIGGKKGAGIGALAGLGGSALYTYKIRKRNHR